MEKHRFAWSSTHCASLSLIMLGLLSGTANGGTLTVLHTFCSGSLYCPETGSGASDMIEDSNGNFYGVNLNENSSSAGGGYGDVYELTSSGSYNVLYNFCSETDCTDGSHPSGKLVLDSSGNLYGVTYDGGTAGYGTIFELSPGTPWTLSTLYTFCAVSCDNGQNPAGGLTYVGAGSSLYNGSSTLYGVTSNGGTYSNGEVYEVTSVGSSPTVTALHSFCSDSDCDDGNYPNALITDSSGNLYGSTEYGGNGGAGGTSGAGVVFEVSSSGTYTALYLFCGGGGSCSDGETPGGPLALDSSGNLLGTASAGGAYAKGVIFKVIPDGSSSTESVVYSFCPSAGCASGSLPSTGVSFTSGGSIRGTAIRGGANSDGVIFGMTGSTETPLYSFCSLTDCTDGKLPNTGVIVDGSGNVFGTTKWGGVGVKNGVIFEWTP
jgi:uncharacterized repeat protein (TIGR03803 family)